MISKDILKRIKQIQIHTKRLLRGSLVGQNSSSVKGAGFEFDQIREYQHGDDVRFIDWKSSARTNSLMMRQYIEERSRTIVLAVDISASTLFSSGKMTKQMVMQEVAAVLALVSDMAKDKVALLLFSDVVELYIPPNTGQKHVRYLLERLFSFEARHKKTSVHTALEYIAKLHIKDAVVFVVSDFISAPFEKALRIVAKKCELIAIRCLDKNELEVPPVGLITMVDIETGQEITLNMRSKKTKSSIYCKKRVYEQNRMLNKYGIDVLEVRAGQSYITDMVTFFKMRLLY